MNVVAAQAVVRPVGGVRCPVDDQLTAGRVVLVEAEVPRQGIHDHASFAASKACSPRWSAGSPVVSEPRLSVEPGVTSFVVPVRQFSGLPPRWTFQIEFSVTNLT